MTTTSFWWVRHGPPTHAKTMVGWSDLPADLSDTPPQLDRLSAYLPDGAPVISSDLIRSRATADAIAQGRPPRLPDDPPRLREIHFGDWELKTFDEIDATHGALSRQFWDEPGHITAPPNGESWYQAESRVSAAVAALRGPPANIVIVAHFGVILTQLALALQKAPPADILAQRIDNLSLTRITLGPEGGAKVGGEINHLP